MVDDFACSNAGTAVAVVASLFVEPAEPAKGVSVKRVAEDAGVRPLGLASLRC